MSAVVSTGTARGRSTTVEVHRGLDERIDPLDFLADADDARVFYFERPADAVAIAAVGAVVATGAGERAGAGAPDASTLRVGGFAFDPSSEPTGLWEGFPAEDWAVPRIALRQEGRRAHLQAAATEEEGGAARAEAEIDAVLARLARPRSRHEPVVRVGYRLEPLTSAEAWRDAVNETLAEIRAGRLSKVVLARAAQIVADAPWREVHIARRLRDAHPTSTVFAVSHGGKTLVGATPERLARLEQGTLTTAAVAGTAPPAPLGGAEDAAFLSNPKERHEHAVVVDELRRRLEPLVRELSAPNEPSVLSTASLRHLHTPMSARLAAGTDLGAVCRALHPTPAVCGLPRAAAREALRERESTPRGWYAGGIGWQDGNGGEVVVPLRAALLDGRVATLFAGAGIVEGSRWESELEETRLKMRVMQAALLEV